MSLKKIERIFMKILS